MVPPDRAITPVESWCPAAPPPTIAAMQLITPPDARPRPSAAPLVLGTVIGTVLVLAWIAFTTPVLTQALPVGRPDAGQMASGVVIWAVALVAPAGFVIVGM